jgi:prepilin-type processing-associated H-X9-DG protein
MEAWTVSKRMPNAFCLTELIVVTSILFLLVAMILPTIQRVREAANLLACANHLRQLGLAAHHYHQDYVSLPPGYLGPSIQNQTDRAKYTKEGQWVGHLPMLLPYLERRELFDRLQIQWGLRDVSPILWSWRDVDQSPHIDNYSTGMITTRLFTCPSTPPYYPTAGDPDPAAGGTLLGIHVYNDKRDPLTSYWLGDYIKAEQFKYLARTNYLGVAGCGTGDNPDYCRWQGVYTNRSKTTLGQITNHDGASNTLLYGESSQLEKFDISWIGGGALGTYQGLKRSSAATFTSFSSCHSAGVQFCFADGSVRLLRFGDTRWNGTPFNNRTDWLCLQQLAGWRDGDSTESSLFE